MKSVTLLGNGGAARAALVALKIMKIDKVRIQARDMALAKKLAQEFGLTAQPMLFTDRIESDGLINSTPLGMTGKDCLNCDVSRLPEKGWVFDMVTVPPVTPLIHAAASRGLTTINGIDMLVEQAASSFHLFFGVAPPRERDPELRRKLGQ
jgi:shikimate dehydrogenase